MRPFAILLALLLTAQLAVDAAVVAEPFPPARLNTLYIERYDKGLSISLRLADDTIIYKVTNGKDVIDSRTVRPSPDDWLQFIKGLNDAKVYLWTPKYYYPGQGETWVIDFTMDDRKFISSGTNEYPLNDDPAKGQANPLSGPSVPFQLFWQTVLKLVGKPTVAATQCPGKNPAASAAVPAAK